MSRSPFCFPSCFERVLSPNRRLAIRYLYVVLSELSNVAVNGKVLHPLPLQSRFRVELGNVLLVAVLPVGQVSSVGTVIHHFRVSLILLCVFHVRFVTTLTAFVRPLRMRPPPLDTKCH